MANGGEGLHRNRTQEVAGSSPASSTGERPAKQAFLFSRKATKLAENSTWSSFGQVARRNIDPSYHSFRRKCRFPAALPSRLTNSNRRPHSMNKGGASTGRSVHRSVMAGVGVGAGA